MRCIFPPNFLESIDNFCLHQAVVKNIKSLDFLLVGHDGMGCRKKKTIEYYSLNKSIFREIDRIVSPLAKSLTTPLVLVVNYSTKQKIVLLNARRNSNMVNCMFLFIKTIFFIDSFQGWVSIIINFINSCMACKIYAFKQFSSSHWVCNFLYLDFQARFYSLVE